MSEKKIIDVKFLENNLKNFASYLINDDILKINDTKTTWSTSKIKKEINNRVKFIVVNDHSDLLSITSTSNIIAYQTFDETIGTDIFKKGFYIYFSSTSLWEYIELGTKIVKITQADYDLLVKDEKVDPEVYYVITDIVLNKYKTTISGDGVTEEFTITHNLNTEDIILTLKDIDGNICFIDYTIIDDQSIIIKYANAPTITDKYTLTISAL